MSTSLPTPFYPQEYYDFDNASISEKHAKELFAVLTRGKTLAEIDQVEAIFQLLNSEQQNMVVGRLSEFQLRKDGSQPLDEKLVAEKLATARKMFAKFLRIE